MLAVVGAAILALITILVLAQWFSRREPAQLDAAMLFGALALGLGVTQVARLGVPPATEPLLGVVAGVGIVAYPLLLLRVVRQFRRVHVLMWALGLAILAGGVVLVVGRALGVAERVLGGPAASAVVLAAMGFVTLYAAMAFLLGSTHSQGVPQRRMAFAAAASLTLGVAALLRPVATLAGTSIPQMLPTAVAIVSFVLFFVAFTPPPSLLRAWHARELQRYLEALDAQHVPDRARQSVWLLVLTANRLLGGRAAVVFLDRRAIAPQAEEPWWEGRVEALAAAFEAYRDAECLHRWDEPLPSGTGHLVVVPIVAAGRRYGTLASPLERPPLFLQDTLHVIRLLADQAALTLSLEEAAKEQERLVLEQYRADSRALQREKQALEEASRLKSGFLANMSHELRTPLNSIIGFTELLRSGRVGRSDDKTHEFLGEILVSAQHLHRLINDVLDLAKVEAGRLDFDPRPTDLHVLCEEAVGILRTAMAEKGHQIEVHVEPEVRFVVLDQTRLKQVLYNYLTNAVKFSDGGRVEVVAAPAPGDRVRISVEDHGIGISPEDQKRLFQEFEQLEAGRGKRRQGTGLGLALVKRLVEAQGGQVGVESIVGEGSVFWAEVPRQHVPVEAPQAVRLNAGARVLVVEDDRQDRQRLEESLDGAGYNVDSVATAAEAVRRVRHVGYDAVVLDLILPDGSGTAVLEALHSGGPNQETPVIVVSIVPRKEIALAFPVEDYLEKPLRPQALLKALQSAGVLPRTDRPILIVDDDEAALRLAGSELEAAGFRLRTARDGREAIERVKEDPPALVVLDLVMPGIDGFGFLKWLRETPGYQSIPVVVWSAKNLGRAEREQLRTAAQDILSKNGGSHGLLGALRKAISKPEGTLPVEA